MGNDKTTRRNFLSYILSAAGITMSGCVAEKNKENNKEGVDSGASPYSIIPQVVWDFETNGAIWGSVAITEGALYVGSNDGYMYAFEEKGEGKGVEDSHNINERNSLRNIGSTDIPGPIHEVKEKWRFPTNGLVASTPVVADGSLYFGSVDNFFYSISSETGDLNWRVDSGGLIGGSPAIAQDMVYFSSGNTNQLSNINVNHNGSGKLYAVRREDGGTVWSVESEEGIQSPPTVTEDILYYGGQDGGFYALDAKTGEEVWEYNADGMFCRNSPAIKDGIVYAGCEDHKMYAFNSSDGEKIWEFETSDVIISHPVVTNEKVYFGSNDGNLYALDSNTGEKMWDFKTDRGIVTSPAYSNGIIYVGSMDNNLYAVNAKTGDIVWEYQTQGPIASNPVISQNTVYFGSNDKKIRAVRNKQINDEAHDEYLQELRKREKKDENIIQEYYGDELST